MSLNKTFISIQKNLTLQQKNLLTYEQILQQKLHCRTKNLTLQHPDKNKDYYHDRRAFEQRRYLRCVFYTFMYRCVVLRAKASLSA